LAQAVFLDRDGVLDALIYNPLTREYESPHRLEDLEMLPRIEEPLKLLQEKGFLLFLVSNQPSYAKGKTTLENIHAIHDKMHEQLIKAGIFFTEYYYCYHHPEGIKAGYSGPCQCRKPSPYFLLQARDKYKLDLSRSWMVGDQGRDIACGKAAGVKTILVEYAHSSDRRKEADAQPDHTAPDLFGAVRIIIERL